MEKQENDTDIIKRKEWQSHSLITHTYWKWGLVILGILTLASSIISIIFSCLILFEKKVDLLFYFGNLCLTAFLIITLVIFFVLLMKQHQELALKEQEILNALFKEEKTKAIQKMYKSPTPPSPYESIETRIRLLKEIDSISQIDEETKKLIISQIQEIK